MQIEDIQTAMATAVQGVPLRRFTRGQFLDFVLSLVQDLIEKFDLSQLTPEQKQAILLQVKAGFDQLAKLLDIPGVPEFAEVIIEQQLIWPIVERAAKKMLGL